MGAYWIREIDGKRYAEVIHYLNRQEPTRFPPLEQKHIDRGYWWLASTENKTIVGFAGMVEMIPFPNVAYLKRAYVTPAHRGNGIQLQFLRMREARAVDLGWTMLIAECADNPVSSANFIKARFTTVEPEQAWGEPGSIYFSKRLSAQEV